ncbi:MAG: BrnA antitoxin family protein [Proteobacteria bacterium]|nr:BrnA antitoxin family protein [Pseudomonadota bacterium]
MLLKTKSGRLVEVPTADEEAAINAGIAADPDNPEWTKEQFDQARPASEVLPPEIYTALIAMKRPRGRPKADETKVFTAIRLDADLLDAFKSTGKGWQTRINAALRQFIAEHPVKC